jgi:hypothetical protein
LGTGGQSTPWSTAVLAEIYLLKFEAAVRAAKEAPITTPAARFVPASVSATRACGGIRRPDSAARLQLGGPFDSEQFSSTPRTCGRFRGILSVL